MGNDDYARKLKERREAEQRKLVEKRKVRNEPSSRAEFDLTETKSESIEKVKADTDISSEEVKRTIAEGAVNAEAVKKISDAPPDETDEEKEARLLKVRKEIYNKHKSAIETKYNEAKQIVNKKKAEEVKGVEDEHKSTLESHKSDLDETLTEDDDPSYRREARQNYRDSVAEEEEAHKDNLSSIAEEYKESFDSLKDEFTTKLDDLLQHYEEDIAAIKDTTYSDADLELCQKEFEAETITFDALEEYESDDDSSSSSDYSYSPSFNIFRIIPGIIGVGVVFMVGWMVIGQVNTALVDSGQYNTTTTGIVDIIPSIGGLSSPLMIMLLLLPMLVILPMILRMFRFDRF